MSAPCRIRGGSVKLLLVALALAASACAAEPEKAADPWSRAQQRINEFLLEALKAGAGHPWAGEYYKGDGLGDNETLTLAPGHGYGYEQSGDTGFYKPVVGTERETGGALYLDGSGDEDLDSGLIVVHWGKRHYLIPRRRLADFANAVNSGTEPRKDSYGMFFLRRGDWRLPVSGLPELPKEGRALLLAHPVSARIVAVGEDRLESADKDSDIVTTVTLSAGRRDGVLPGLKLSAEDDLMDVKVTQADARRATAEVRRFRGHAPPKVGDVLLSRPRWARDLDARGVPSLPIKRLVPGLPPFRGAIYQLEDRSGLEIPRRYGMTARLVGYVDVPRAYEVEFGHEIEKPLDELVAGIGANARTSARVDEAGKGPVRVEAWRLELDGEAADLMWPIYSDSDAEWKKALARRALDRLPSEVARLRILDEEAGALLHVSAGQFSHLGSLRVEDLDEEQREAFVTEYGLRAWSGPIRGAEVDRKVNDRFYQELQMKAKPRVDAYDAAHPAELKEYEAKEAEWQRLEDAATAEDQKRLHIR